MNGFGNRKVKCHGMIRNLVKTSERSVVCVKAGIQGVCVIKHLAPSAVDKYYTMQNKEAQLEQYSAAQCSTSMLLGKWEGFTKRSK